MAAALEQAREVELEGHCWCLSGAAPRRFASVGVMRPSEPPAARVSRCLRRPASLLWVAIGCPQRPSLVALGSASFRRRVRTDGCVGPLRSHPEARRNPLKKNSGPKSRPPGVKSFRGGGQGQSSASRSRYERATHRSLLQLVRAPADEPRPWLRFPRPPRARRRAWPAAPRLGPSRATLIWEAT